MKSHPVQVEPVEVEPVLVSPMQADREDSGALVSDTFTRANSAVSLGTADSGHAWTANAGTWGISSNQAYNPTASAEGTATVDAGISDGVIEVTITTHGSGQPRLIARLTDSSNFVSLAFVTDTFFLQKRVATAYTTLDSDAYAIADGDRWRLTLRGGVLTGEVIRGGTVLVTLTATDAFNDDATKWGLGIAATTNATAIRWDNLTVTA